MKNTLTCKSMRVHVAVAVDLIVNFAGAFDPPSEREDFENGIPPGFFGEGVGRWQGHDCFRINTAITLLMLTQKDLVRNETIPINCCKYSIFIFRRRGRTSWFNNFPGARLWPMLAKAGHPAQRHIDNRITGRSISHKNISTRVNRPPSAALLDGTPGFLPIVSGQIQYS